MKVFDFNIHLPSIDADDTCDRIASEVTPCRKTVSEVYIEHRENIAGKIDSMNLMCLRRDVMDRADELEDVIQLATKDCERVYLSAMADFRSQNICETIDEARSVGMTGIKFHSYIQNISEKDYEHILRVAQHAEHLGIFICIDTSYGTAGMYEYDNLKLASFIARCVKKVPIILLHSGGSRVLDAMHLAVASKNIFLETSFSLDYYRGSSIAGDFAFAYKKIGSDRILYASDYPYVALDKSMEDTCKYLERNGFTAGQIDKIMHNNAFGLA